MSKIKINLLDCEFSVRIWMVIISIAVICSDNRFWMFFSTWRGGSYTQVGITLLALTTLPLACILYKDNHPLKARYLIPCTVLFIMTAVYYRFGLTGVSMPTRVLVLIIVMYLIFNFSEKRKAAFLEIFTVVFAAAMLLGLAYYLLRWAGLDLTTMVLESPNPGKTALNQYYSISPFGVLLNKRIGFDYCGYFDESGCLGTYAALLFIATRGLARVSSGRGVLWLARIVLLVEGAVSLSFAFYLIMGIYLLVQCAVTRRWSLLLALIVVIAAVIFVMNLNVENETLIRLQQRLGSLIGGNGDVDNRLTDSANAKMGEFFVSGDVLVKLFGFGPGEFSSWQTSHVVDGASVYYYLYDRGYIGMLLYFGAIIAAFFYSGRPFARNWLLLAFFLISTYQRPEVFSSFYMIVLLLGATDYCVRPLEAGSHSLSRHSIGSMQLFPRRKAQSCK